MGYIAAFQRSRRFFWHPYCHIYDCHITYVICVIYDIYGIYDTYDTLTYAIWQMYIWPYGCQKNRLDLRNAAMYPKMHWKIFSVVKIEENRGLQISFVFLKISFVYFGGPEGGLPDHLESWNFFWYLTWPIGMGKCTQLIQIPTFGFFDHP